MKKSVILGSTIILCFLKTIISHGQTLPEIDLLIEKEMAAQNIPAMAVAIIKSGKLVHISASGFRDIEAKKKATIHTPFQIASISKPVTSMAVFQLIESGKIDLNSDINKYLPFRVENPYHPKDIITIKDLLNHRSGIRDDHTYYGPYWNKPRGDTKVHLGDFVEDYLNANGNLYKKKHFEESSDYKFYSYSNTGYALLGFIVEYVSETDFEEYCQQNVFKPMGMVNTSWFLENLDINQVAKPYSGTKKLKFRGHNGYPDYPAGQLRTSISDYSNLISGYLNSENSQFILSSATTSKITPNPQDSLEYHTWHLDPVPYYYHGGGDPGVRTGVIIFVDEKNGLITFANGENYRNNFTIELRKMVFGK